MNPEHSTVGPLPQGPALGSPGGPQTAPEEDGESLLALVQHYLGILMRRKLVVAIVVALSVGGGYLWLRAQVPIYRATAMVMIDSNPPKLFWNVRDVVELGSPKHYRGQVTYFETQYRIIKSHKVAEAVLNAEGLWNDEHLLGLDNPDKPLTPAEKDEIIKNAHMPSVLAGRIGVRPVSNSMLVHIDFQDSDPAFATRIVNAVARAYEQYNLGYKKEIVEKATTDLEAQEKSKLTSLVAAEEAVLAFEAQHNVGNIEHTKKAINDQLDRLAVDLDDIRTKRSQAEAEWQSLKPALDVTDPFSVKAGEILDNAVIRTLKQQIVAVQSELAALKARYLDKHPEVVAKQQQLRVLNSIARKEIKNLAEAVKLRLVEHRKVESALEAAMAEARERQTHISTLLLEYARLVDERKKLKSSHTVVAKRLDETQMSSGFEANNVRIMENAIQPSAPVSPRRSIVLVGSLLLGLLLAVAVALLLDYADATVKNWKDLEERIGHKVLGVIPVIGNRPQRGDMTPADRRHRDLFIYDNPTSNVAEASRTLRTNLLFMSTARKIETLLITSANPSEGKSMMASHTATSMAASGSRVLLVEADMRRPRLAGSFQLSPDVGLSTCLVSGDPVADHVQKTEVENLDVMVCGPVPPNPAELLHTPRFLQLMDEMKERYDTIIFDSPPLLPVADAMVLAQQVDGVLVVVRAGQTSRHALRHAVRHLTSIEAPILGMVLNHQTTSRKGYGYGYGYGQGYGYGYGYSSKESEAEAT